MFIKLFEVMQYLITKQLGHHSAVSKWFNLICEALLATTYCAYRNQSQNLSIQHDRNLTNPMKARIRRDHMEFHTPFHPHSLVGKFLPTNVRTHIPTRE